MQYNNQLPQDVFLFGANYAPYALGEDWPMDEWERDLQTMKELNFNTIRVFAAWARIEPEQDVYDFTKLDYLFALAEKLDLKVVLCFGGLFTSLCGVGKPWYLRDLTPWCRDNPALRHRAMKFMAKTITRYAPSEKLIAWMIWNEPDYGSCSCEHTIARFRDWLRNRYENIAALNQVWGGSVPVRFTSFDEIPGAVGDNIASRMDFARFHQWSLAKDMSELTELALALDPKKRPTTANLVYHRTVQEGPFTILDSGMNTALDGQAMTLMGVSCYTTEHYYDPLPDYTVSFKLSRLRGASQDVHKRMVTIETGAGPNIREHTIKSREALMWQQIGQNTKMLLAWNYRSRVDGGQVGLFHLMAFDGSVSTRGQAFADLGNRLQKSAALLNRVYPKNEAAILTLEDTLTLLATNYSESVHAPLNLHRVQESRFGAYRLLYDRGIGADCIGETALDTLNQYKLLLLPAQEQMTPKLAEAIRAYVEQGGTVIAEAPFGFRSENGRLLYHFPAYGLQEVFGGFGNDRHRDTEAAFTWKDGTSKAVDFLCDWKTEGAEVVASWNDGAPAVLEHRYGKGRAILYGTEVFRRYAEDNTDPVAALLNAQLRDTDLKSSLETEGLVNGSDVEIAALYGENGEKVWILINHSKETRGFRVNAAEPLYTLEGEVFDGKAMMEPLDVLVLTNAAKE